MSKPLPALFQRLDRSLQTAVATMPVMFNPTELTLNKGVQLSETVIPGLDMPIIQFVRGQTETLSLELFFDSTDAGTGVVAAPVTVLTDLFYELVKIDRELHAPPVCRFVWGPFGFPGTNLTGNWASQSRQNGFQCVVESVRQRFTLFSPIGFPLRATLSLSLKEYQTLDEQIKKIDFQSADHTKAHTVRGGETLSQIAAEAYGDPSRWRAIAETNLIVDPLDLEAGRLLTIPPLPNGGAL